MTASELSRTELGRSIRNAFVHACTLDALLSGPVPAGALARARGLNGLVRRETESAVREYEALEGGSLVGVAGTAPSATGEGEHGDVGSRSLGRTRGEIIPKAESEDDGA